ncbi:MAG: right-handed parallel beta-helix repeat-containing protein [Candidatus Sumerlaeia bacterium]|nr:right-handed parallel beta-helix repeat-containing protein [Candidatus Sumerlaeia bacterium]
MHPARLLLACVIIAMAGSPAFAAFSIVETVTNTNDSGTGSLRQAIINSNVSSFLSQIRFAIPGSGPHVISPQSPLPALSTNIDISGASQRGPDGEPLIVISGTFAGTGANGLLLTAPSSVVNSLTITGFDGAGIRITAGPTCRVIGCTLGGIVGNRNGIQIDAPTSAQPSGSDPFSHVIGGFASTEANVISGNQIAGILINNAVGVQVRGNRIGTNRAGNTPLPNGVGVHIFGTSNVIGGIEPGAGNLISGNNVHGLLIVDGGNAVQGNIIGLAADGDTPLGNGVDGVRVFGFNNHIGGASVAARNLISGNTGDGVHIGGPSLDDTSGDTLVQGNFIGTDGTGTLDRGNGGNGVFIEGFASGNRIGNASPGAGNLISGNAGHGVLISGLNAQSNRIQGNTIGTDVTGMTVSPSGGSGTLRNDLGGIRLENQASGTTVGGAGAVARNLISGHRRNIEMEGSIGNVIQGNYIGTNRTGTGQPETPGFFLIQTGISVSNGSDGNLIGGSASGEGNLISGNDVGVSLSTDNNDIVGNMVGLTADGAGRVPGTRVGVQISGLTGEHIGNRIMHNVISGNSQTGLTMSHTGFVNESITHNIVQGNFIGTDVTGRFAVPNGTGFALGNVSDNIVGGPLPGQGNVISGNTGLGIQVVAGSPNLIFFNSIGVNVDGMPLGNGSAGISVESIPDRIRISRNRIFANGGLGIDLRAAGGDSPGVTENDTDDSDAGGNDLQNFPELQEANFSGPMARFRGTLRSRPNTQYEIELFASEGPDATGHGEGDLFLFSFFTATDSNGAVAWDEQRMLARPPGRFITATAIDPNGNTSEFSPAIPITGSGPTENEIVYALLGIIGLRPEMNLNGDGVTDAADLVGLLNQP